ncbi:MAG: Uma2 family endonuclease [Armatimonadetes bacterium]|nr:Uma2 family endonuclease [Armatimonadota bacterium]
MEAMRRDVKFTYRDYLGLPEDKRYELIDGEFHLTPAPGELHQRISRELEFELMMYCKSHKGWILYDAPFDVVLSDINVVQPDILLIHAKRKGIITPHYVRSAPDICIEILYPSTSQRDVEVKRQLYLKYGVQEYWIVDPEAQTVEVLLAGKDFFETHRVFTVATPLSSPLLPDLSLDLRKVFAEE